jgi:putative hydrolase of the HAD superfamily
MTGAAATVFVDADNTLWDTDAVFAHAQIQLLSEVESAVGINSTANDRLAFIRALDQQLAEHHHHGLRYPPRLLARAAALALAGFSAGRAARSAWLGELKLPFGEEVAAAVEQSYIASVPPPPALRPGVIEGLDRLLEDGC